MNKSKTISLILTTVMVIGLICFELFNFSTTEASFYKLFGTAAFMSITWSNLLAIAFCFVDLGGVAKIFTIEQGKDEKKEISVLFGGWMVSVAINAFLTAYGVADVMTGRDMGNSLISNANVIMFAPILIAIVVVLIRVSLVLAFASYMDGYLMNNFVRDVSKPKPASSQQIRPGNSTKEERNQHLGTGRPQSIPQPQVRPQGIPNKGSGF